MKGRVGYVGYYFRVLLLLRTDSCDERRIYKSEDISGPEGGKYMFNTSPKSSQFPPNECSLWVCETVCLRND